MLDQWEYKLWLALKVCYCTPHDKQTQLSSPRCSASLTPLPSLAPKKAGVKTAKNGRMRCWGDFKRPAKGKPLEQITYSVHDWRSSHCKEHKYEYIFQTPQEHKKKQEGPAIWTEAWLRSLTNQQQTHLSQFSKRMRALRNLYLNPLMGTSGALEMNNAQ